MFQLSNQNNFITVKHVYFACKYFSQISSLFFKRKIFMPRNFSYHTYIVYTCTYMSQYDLRSVESPKCPIRRFYCHGSWISESVESPIGDSTGRIPDLSMVLTMCDTFALGTHVWYYITSLSLATSANWCQVWNGHFEWRCLIDIAFWMVLYCTLNDIL